MKVKGVPPVMLYMGIDVGKNNHEAGMITAEGKHLGQSLRFANTAEGYAKLTSFIAAKRPADEPFKIGMEATGHYWLALYSFLFAQGFDVAVINPIQSDSLRNFHIRQTKTDSVDSFLIAEVIRFGQYEPTHLADEELLDLRLRELNLLNQQLDLKGKGLSRQPDSDGIPGSSLEFLGLAGAETAATGFF